MKILGIDPGTASTGYGIMNIADKETYDSLYPTTNNGSGTLPYCDIYPVTISVEDTKPENMRKLGKMKPYHRYGSGMVSFRS